MIKSILLILVGIFFGIIMVESQIISWYRIQEMVLFESFHMYGVITTAIITGMIGLQLIKRLKLNGLNKSHPRPALRPFDKKQVVGGVLFGIGWAITGACPGPLIGLVGKGHLIYLVALSGALLGGLVFYLFESNNRKAKVN